MMPTTSGDAASNAAQKQVSPHLTRRDVLKLGGTAALAAFATPTLISCGSLIKSSSTGATTLTITNRWSDPVAKKVMTTLFSKFEQEYPAIKINNDVRPNSGDTYQPAVRTAFASSAPPDIATDIAGPEVYNLANAGVLRDLTSFYKEQIQPRALAGADTGSTLNGKVWGISAGVNVGNILWYNPDYLKKYGLDGSQVQTWDDWIQQLKTVESKGGTPIYFGAKDLWPGGHYLNDLVQRTLGSKATETLYNRTVLANQPASPRWTDPAVVKAFQMFIDLKPYFQPGYLGEASATADAQFLNGQSGWHEMGGWLINTILAQPPSFQPGLILFPAIAQYPGKQKEVTIANTSLIVGKNAPGDAVQKFLLFFTRPDNVLFMVENLNQPIPYKYDTSKVQVDAKIKPIFDAMNTMVANAGTDGAVLYNDEAVKVDLYTKYIWQGSTALLTGALTPEQLLQQLENDTVASNGS
jgi:raffinose/stachyose/melibiose transport system substrate-binding protein